MYYLPPSLLLLSVNPLIYLLYAIVGRTSSVSSYSLILTIKQKTERVNLPISSVYFFHVFFFNQNSNLINLTLGVKRENSSSSTVSDVSYFRILNRSPKLTVLCTKLNIPFALTLDCLLFIWKYSLTFSVRLQSPIFLNHQGQIFKHNDNSWFESPLMSLPVKRTN